MFVISLYIIPFPYFLTLFFPSFFSPYCFFFFFFFSSAFLYLCVHLFVFRSHPPLLEIAKIDSYGLYNLGREEIRNKIPGSRDISKSYGIDFLAADAREIRRFS